MSVCLCVSTVDVCVCVCVCVCACGNALWRLTAFTDWLFINSERRREGGGEREIERHGKKQKERGRERERARHLNLGKQTA